MAYQGLTYELQAVMPEAIRTGLFDSATATIQAPDGLIGPSGAPSGTFVNVSGMVNIPCMAAPPSSARIQATEVKGLEEIMSLGIRHCLLDGYFTGILTQWRLLLTFYQNGTLIGTITFDILGSEADSQTQMTRIEMRTAGI
jgi:hypothetical protein